MDSMASFILYVLIHSHSKARGEERDAGSLSPSAFDLLALIIEEKSFPEAPWQTHFLLYLSFLDHKNMWAFLAFKSSGKVNTSVRGPSRGKWLGMTVGWAPKSNAMFL